MPVARQRVAKHIPAEENARNNRTSIARQRRGKQALSTIQDVFLWVRLEDCISSLVVNQKSIRELRERENGNVNGASLTQSFSVSCYN
jgi:hypothetical protein